jgi:hypothetical protein
LITKDEARERALALASDGKHVVEILHAETLEYDFGWVFFYQAEEFLRTRDPGKALYGNAPIIVERQSGRAVLTGTAYSTAEFVNAYRALGFDQFSAGGWRKYLAGPPLEEEE